MKALICASIIAFAACSVAGPPALKANEAALTGSVLRIDKVHKTFTVRTTILERPGQKPTRSVGTSTFSFGRSTTFTSGEAMSMSFELHMLAPRQTIRVVYDTKAPDKVKPAKVITIAESHG